MAKKQHPAIENPLAGMGLDDIVRGITSSGATTQPAAAGEQPQPAAKKPARKAPKKGTGMRLFDENLAKYTGVSEQGVAIWLPREVKKQLELIRVNASRNIPLRSLAAAIIMTYIAEHEEKLENL